MESSPRTTFWLGRPQSWPCPLPAIFLAGGEFFFGLGDFILRFALDRKSTRFSGTGSHRQRHSLPGVPRRAACISRSEWLRSSLISDCWRERHPWPHPLRGWQRPMHRSSRCLLQSFPPPPRSKPFFGGIALLAAFSSARSVAGGRCVFKLCFIVGLVPANLACSPPG